MPEGSLQLEGSYAGRRMTALYRHFDASSRLLYVGVTSDLERRTKQHKAESRWYSEVCRTEVRIFADRAEAEAAEREEIRKSAPVHNAAFGVPSRIASANSRDLIDRIDRFAAATGLEPSTICQYAVRNSALYSRLKAGGECLPRTASRLLSWMDTHVARQAAE